MVRSSIITSTGPLVLSGFAAGVSVEGPMASVSARFKFAGGAGFADDDAASWLSSEGSISAADGAGTSTGLVTDASGTGAAVLVDVGPAADAGSVLSSTGLDDNGSCLLCGRDPESMCCGALCAAVGGWSTGEAMAGRDYGKCTRR